MRKGKQWPTHVWVFIVLAGITLLSSLYGNYLSFQQGQHPKAAQGGVAVSTFPVVLTSISAVACLFLLLLIVWLMIRLETTPTANRGRGRREANNALDAVLLNAPHLLVKHSRPDVGDELVFINDGQAAAINVTVQPLVRVSQRPITMFPSTLSVVHGTPERCHVVVGIRPSLPNATINLGAVLSDGMESDDSVTVSFDDSKGNGFCQEFKVAREGDGTITWEPGPVRLRS